LISDSAFWVSWNISKKIIVDNHFCAQMNINLKAFCDVAIFLFVIFPYFFAKERGETPLRLFLRAASSNFPLLKSPPAPAPQPATVRPPGHGSPRGGGIPHPPCPQVGLVFSKGFLNYFFCDLRRSGTIPIPPKRLNLCDSNRVAKHFSSWMDFFLE